MGAAIGYGIKSIIRAVTPPASAGISTKGDDYGGESCDISGQNCRSITVAEKQYLDYGVADVGVGNTINGLGGLGQIGTGVAACATGLGCVAGVPLIVLGVSNVGESITSMISTDSVGFNLVQQSLNLSPATNSVVNLTADLAGLNAPAIAKGSWKLFIRMPSDYTAIKYQTSRAGVVLNAASTANTTVNGVK